MPNVPAIRLMGESGSGKSSLTRLILSEHHKNQPSLILLHDPQADTDEDRWGIEKASDTADSTAKALKKLAVDVENKVRLTNRTFYVFDELDGQCQKDRDVKKALLTIAKKARHIKGMYVLFLGQSSNVGRVGLEWVDMGNFAAIYIGESALHAIEKSPKLVSLQAKLKGQYHEISEWCECKDKLQFIDSHEAHAHRFALVVIPGKEPYWELLPSFTEGIEGYTKPLPGLTQIVPESAQGLPDVAQMLPDETLKVLENRLPDRLPASPVESLPCLPILPTCPTCGSQDLASRGVQWGCKSCRKRFNKEVKK